MAAAKASGSSPATYTAAGPADTRVSVRSKATEGRSKAMYSSVLFMVEASLKQVAGSGDRPTVAVDR